MPISNVDETWQGQNLTATEFETITGVINDLVDRVNGLGTASTLNMSAPAATLPASPVPGQIASKTGGAAPTPGGTLTGTWPNLTIGAGKVTTSMIADGAITAAKLDSAIAPIFAYKTTDQTLTSATSSVAVDITDLTFDADTLGASSVWEITGMIRYQAVTAGDLQLIWTLPSGATIYGVNGGPNKGAGSPTASQGNWADVAGTDADRYVIGGNGAGTANITIAFPRWLLVMGTTLTDPVLTGKQYATDATKPIIMQHSYLKATQVA